ncbi:MAG: tyrosine-type recombinase/integrase [Anaerofustis sp.]
MDTVDLYLKSIQHTVSYETIKGYAADLASFNGFLKKRFHLSDLELDSNENKFLTEITEADLYAYINYIQNEYGNGSHALNRKISVLRGYFKYLTRERILMRNPAGSIESVKVHKALDYIPNIEECNELIASIKGKNAKRDKLLIGLILICGLKVSELTAIETTDVNLSQNCMGIREDSDCIRYVYYNDALKSILSDFLKTDQYLYLFESDEKKSISKRTVHQIVVKYLSSSGMYQKGTTTESLRKTCKTFLKKYCKMDSLQIEKYLGRKLDQDTELVSPSRELLNKISIDFEE